jgi:hypothetical protein
LRKRLGPGNTPTPHRCELSPGWHGAKSGSKDSTLGDQSIASRESALSAWNQRVRSGAPHGFTAVQCGRAMKWSAKGPSGFHLQELSHVHFADADWIS